MSIQSNNFIGQSTLDGNAIIKIDTGLQSGIQLFDLVSEHDPILKQKCVPWDFAHPPRHSGQFAFSLFETMAKAKGIGLSANQVGFPWAVFVAGTEDEREAFFNPEILEMNIYQTSSGQEGCLTYPALSLIVRRSQSIKVRWQDISGQTKEAQFSGLTARIIQHEMDHMNGILFPSKVGKLAFDMANKRRLKFLKKVARTQKKAQQIETEQRKENKTIDVTSWFTKDGKIPF